MKKGGRILVSIFLLSLCMVIGIFIGRNHKEEYVEFNQHSEISTVPVLDAVSDFRLDINVATKVQLMDLPGIGETIAQRIIDYRTDNGPFLTTDDLMNVEGIGQGKLETIAELIKVGE